MKRTVLSLLLAAGVSSALSGCFALAAGGVAGGALVATDRRSSGSYVDDQGIEAKVASQLSNKLPSAHINTTSYNRAVLLTGEVPSEEARQQAELIARATPNVRRVSDYTVVAPVSGFSERSNDAWITSKVRTRMLDGKGYSPNHVKVVTERGVVYLLGLVTPAEGQAVTQVVSETAGVQKVVTVFESLNEITPDQ
ncbi:MAG: BON domain-containing protein [Aquitalea sp.]|nr:BON domain-containing protein [Aquitalea sp.]